MPKFSLRQMLIAVVVLAIGMAISRLPEGSWFDIPFAALSYYFAVSVSCRARDVARLLARGFCPTPVQVGGGRILLALLLLIIAALPAALALRAATAGELVVVDPSEIAYSSFPAMPLALAALAMLGATSLEPWNDRRSKHLKPRQQVYVTITIVIALAAIVAYWTDQLLLWHLVYLSLAGIEMADPPRLLPLEMQGNTSVRIHAFVDGCLVSMVPLVINVACVASLIKWWNWRRVLTTLLLLGCAAEFVAAWWLAGPGLRQLSLPLSEAVHFPPLTAAAAAALMLVLSAGLLAWRRLATIPADTKSVGIRCRLFHETWMGSSLLGLTAIMALGNVIREVKNSELGGFLDLTDPRSIAQVLFWSPLEYLWWAVAIAGIGQAWTKWRRRCEPLREIMPVVRTAQFLVVVIALLIVSVASAPVIAAFSFSLWFLIFDM